MNKKAVTLVEMVTVLAIIGIAAGLFYAVFMMNWKAFDQNIAQADLAAEMGVIVDGMNRDGRQAKEIRLSQTAATKEAQFVDVQGNPFVNYTMKDTGEFVVSNGGPDDVKTNKLDFVNSHFMLKGNGLQMDIVLKDDAAGHPVHLNSTVEIYPRN